jgi:hypothetical protein
MSPFCTPVFGTEIVVLVVEPTHFAVEPTNAGVTVGFGRAVFATNQSEPYGEPTGGFWPVLSNPTIVPGVPVSPVGPDKF